MSSDKKRRELGGLTQVTNLTNYVIQIFRENDLFLVSTKHFDGIFMQQFEFLSNYLKEKYCSICENVVSFSFSFSENE